MVRSPAAAQDSKPLPQDTQIKLLKAQREMQQQQIKIADLQRQADQSAAAMKQLLAQMEADCVTAAAETKVDLTKFTCDLDKLAFVPKPAESAKPAEKK